MTVVYEPIGVIHTPFESLEGMPIQPGGGVKAEGRVELNEKYVEGLKDLAGFSHIILLYHFHLTKKVSLTVTPFLDKTPRGLFSTRAPRRPNPIGISVVKLSSIEGSILNIENIDVVNGTPLLDIKPYIPKFDGVEIENVRSGWADKGCSDLKGKMSDDRFV